MLPQKLKKRNDYCKHWVHVRDLAERLASLYAVVGCLNLEVPIALLCMAVCYTAHFRLIEIIEKIKGVSF